MAPVTITAITNKVASASVKDCLAQPLTFRLAREAEDALITVPPLNFTVLAPGDEDEVDSGDETVEEEPVLNGSPAAAAKLKGPNMTPLPMKKKISKDKSAVESSKDAVSEKVNGSHAVKRTAEDDDDDEDTDSGESFTEPDEQLFPKHRLPVTWNQRYGPTPGFVNNGVTCYMNSTLQVLLHIPAMVEYLLNVHKKDHASEHDNCMMCTFRKLAEECYKGSNKRKPIYPRYILKKLRGPQYFFFCAFFARIFLH